MTNYDDLQFTCQNQKTEMQQFLDSFVIDFDEFNPVEFPSWVNFIGRITRFPDIFLIDVLTSCFIIRYNLQIRSKIVSFIISLIVATMTDNLLALATNHKLAILEEQLLIPFFIPVWILLNFVPFDIIYKLLRLLKPIVGWFAGFLLGQAVTMGVDAASDLFPSDLFLIALISIGFGLAKYIVILIYARATNQQCCNIFIVLFEVIVAFSMYYWFTDLGHISDKFWFDKEYVRFVVELTIAFFETLRFVVPERFYVAIYSIFERIVSFFVPYYGSTWAPDQ